MSQAVHEFTVEALDWKPYVKPVDVETATAEQLDALKITPSNKKISDYVLVLANEPETLKERTPLFNDIMYSEGGLSRGGREIGALAASFVNRCIYCASVHAARYSTLGCATGSTSRKTLPLPRALLTSMRPWCLATML